MADLDFPLDMRPLLSGEVETLCRLETGVVSRLSAGQQDWSRCRFTDRGGALAGIRSDLRPMAERTLAPALEGIEV